MGLKTLTKFVAHLCLVLAFALLGQHSLWAHDNPYPFDFDPARSEDPEGIADGLEELAALLPGLPAGLVEVEMDGIAFDYYPEILDWIYLARDSGPEIVPPMDRTAVRCAAHAAFILPSNLLRPGLAACTTAAQVVTSAFDGAYKTCQEVEFPEVYVFDYPPGEIDLRSDGTLSNLEDQIGVIGEALSHIDYPVGLMPPDFWPLTRSVIAKIRYSKLSANIDARLAAYEQALMSLQNSTACFETAASVSLQTSIHALISELTQVGAYLDQFYANGLAQAARDRLSVENQGRLRNDLTHPALTDHEREMLAFYLTAIYWRMRGGGLFPDPGLMDIEENAFVVNTFERIAEFAGGLGEDANTVGIRYLIDESAGYSGWWDLGNNPGHDQFYDLWMLTDRGRRGVNLARQFIGDLGYDIKHLVAGGLIMGPCYYAMWYELWARNGRYFKLGENIVDPYYEFLAYHVQTGEVCYGASMGLGLARTLLWGRPNPDCQASCSGRVCGSDGCGGSCGGCVEPAMCSSTGQCFVPGTDAGVVLVDATVTGQDIVVGADATHADNATQTDNASAIDQDATTNMDLRSADTFADTATHNDLNSNTADAGVLVDDANAAGTGSDEDTSEVDEVTSQGCDGCSMFTFDKHPASFLPFFAVLFAALRRRR